MVTTFEAKEDLLETDDDGDEKAQELETNEDTRPPGNVTKTESE
jgi:hypothetical protein